MSGEGNEPLRTVRALLDEIAALRSRIQDLEFELSSSQTSNSHGMVKRTQHPVGKDQVLGEKPDGVEYLDTLDQATRAGVLGRSEDILIPFNKPCLFPECTEAVEVAFSAGKLSGDGLNSQLCMKWFSQKFGFKNCLLTPSCTASLEMAALLLNICPGDEVIVPSFTFVSTASAFALRGANLVFADSECSNPNMSIDDVLKKITSRTKAIVVVHYAGVPIDVVRLAESGIPIVEDCAHALGSIDPKTRDFIGKYSCLATFSFHETKNIGIGEGGLLVVNDSNLWEHAQVIREKGTNRTAFREGRDPFYTWLSLGSSYLMSDVDAGVLWGCLKHFDEIQNRRLTIWDMYNECIWPSTLFEKPSPDISRANGHMYYLKFIDGKAATKFQNHMKRNGVMVTSHYKPLDVSPFITKTQKGIHNQVCKQSALWSETLIRLPLFFALGNEEMNKILEAVNSFSAANNGLTLRPATEEVFEDIRALRNQHRHAFWNTEMIDIETHRLFMSKNAATYRVAVDCDEKVVGFIGHVDGDVRLATESLRVRQGVAAFMWKGFIHEFPQVSVRVRRDNEPSLAFFKKCGLVPVEADVETGQDPLNLVPSSITFMTKGC